MDEIDRRVIIGCAGSAILTPWIGKSVPALAASPVGGKQAPGFYRFKLGDFEITVINEGTRTASLPDRFVTNVAKDQVLAAAEAAYMPKGKIVVPCNAIAVNIGSKLVLIDTGYGSGASTPVGLLTPNLFAAGIDTRDIDMVLISHFHPDHISGLKNSNGPAFPNAEIKVPSLDWAFYMDDENMSRAPEGRVRNYFENSRKIFQGLADRVTPYEWGNDVAPGITAIATPGHTPGHTSFVVASGSDHVLVQGDVTNVPELFARNPDWHVMYDHDPIQAAQTRRRFYDMAAMERTLVAGFHFAFPAIGHIEKDGSGYRLVPAAWSPSL